MSANGLGMDEKQIDRLKGSFDQHVKSTKSNFETLYGKVNDHDIKLSAIVEKVDRIETNTAPIKDIASFFRVMKWISAGLITITPVAAFVVWLAGKLN